MRIVVCMPHPMSVDETLPAKSEQNKNITQKERDMGESGRTNLGLRKLEPTLPSLEFF
ncbi:hypothetical protein EKH55_2702 [Sinorhizobium alkalisoli]|nr:hypothetical protein EKH55_2702 [Sinorhizobium alkalisoli]